MDINLVSGLTGKIYDGKIATAAKAINSIDQKRVKEAIALVQGEFEKYNRKNRTNMDLDKDKLELPKIKLEEELDR